MKIGYEYFDSAAHMDEECEVLKIRLGVEYSLLLEWGDAAGLTDEKRHPEYEKKMKVNQGLIFAILGEIQSRLKRLRKLSLENFSESENSLKGTVELDNSIKRVADITLGHLDSNEKVQNSLKPETAESWGSSQRGLSRESIKHVNFETYAEIFKSPTIPQGKQRHHKVLNTLVAFGKGVKNIVKQPKRMKWALKDRKSIEENIQRISQLTAYLRETLGNTQMQILLDTAQDTWMQVLQLTTTVKEMEHLLTAMQKAKDHSTIQDTMGFTSGGTTLVDSLHSGNISDRDTGRYSSLYEQLIKFSIIVAKSQESSEGMHGVSKRLNDENLKALRQREVSDRGTRTLATYRDKNVWIEWKKYASVVIDLGQGMTTSGPDPEVVKSVERLVALLQTKSRPVEFCAPTCLGYFLVKGKDSRFGLLYEADNSSETIHDPQSLFQRFGERPAFLRDRLRLGQDLATSLMYLHAVNWLHKGFRSASILLFPEQATGEYGKLIISGLEYARPDEVGRTSTGPPEDREWGVYCHPGYLGDRRKRGFRKTYDIYSLGIVLIEIAYWKAAEDILNFKETKGHEQQGLSKADGQQAGHFDKASKSDLENIRRRLLTDNPEILEHIRVTMGERYHSAVRACIVGMEAFGLPEEVDQSDPAIAALLQQAFTSVVVDVLKSIVV